MELYDQTFKKIQVSHQIISGRVLIATSDPKDKETMIKIIKNLIAE